MGSVLRRGVAGSGWLVRLGSTSASSLLRAVTAVLVGTGSAGYGLGFGLLPGLLPSADAAAQQTEETPAPSVQPEDVIYEAVPPDPGEPEFRVTVKQAGEAAERIKVGKNRSIILETSIPYSNVHVVGKDEIIRVEPATPTQLLIKGQEYGVDQVVVWTEGGQRHVIEVSVELDLELLNTVIKDMDPQSDAHGISILGHILLIGTVSSAEVAKQIEDVARLYLTSMASKAQVQNQLRIAGEQQVLLRCVVAEVSRSAVRELGINGFLAGENFGDGFAVNQIGGINPANISPAPTIDVQGRIPFLTKDINLLGPTLSLGFPDLQMQLFIQAMADNTLLRILAEPTLVAVSGEEASFLAGGEFPVPIPQSGQTAGAITIEFKEFGVNLTFTPLVLPHQRIRLKVRPEVSTRDEAGGITTPSGFVPAITTRRVETTVEIASGATIAIAGLLKDEVRGIATRIPGIGDLPVLGALFRSVKYQRSRTELVILVTPEIVAPMRPDQVPEIPGQRMMAPSDLDLYLMGVLEGPEALDDIELAPETEPGQTVRHGSWRSEPQRLSIHGPWGYADPSRP